MGDGEVNTEHPEVVVDFDDGIPVDDDAEPEDAEVKHQASAEEVLTESDGDDGGDE